MLSKIKFQATLRRDNIYKKLQILRKQSIFLFIAAALLILFSCGIGTYIYIYPPLSSGTLSFRHDYRNEKDPDFISLGYDVYYRFYDPDDFDGYSTDEIDSYIRSQATSFFTDSNKNLLISRNLNDDAEYRPVVPVSNDKGYDYSPPPVLPIDDISDYFYINILLSGHEDNPYIETEAPYSSSTYPETVFFSRYLNSGTEIKYFDNVSLSTDEDLPDSYTGGEIYVSFFVLTYGFTYEYETLTSNVLYIGYTSIYPSGF